MQSGPQPDHSPRSSFSQPESASSVSSENRKKDGVQDNPLHAPVRPAGRRLSRAPPKGEKSEADNDGKQELLRSIPEIEQHFEVISKIGEGTFSSVYLVALKTDSNAQFAMKYLVPTSINSRVENEIYCLDKMGGLDHVISLHMYMRHENHVALVMPYFKHDKFIDCLPLMSMVEVRLYMKALFEALRNVHSHGIIHRDIKPSNFLYNRTTRSFQLVDFGLAHMANQTKENRGSMLKVAQSKGRVRSSSSGATHVATARGHGATAQGGGCGGGGDTTIANPSAPLPTFRRQLQRSASKSVRLPLKVRPRPSGSNLKGSLSTSLTLPGKDRKEEERRVCPLRHKENVVCGLCMGRNNQVAPRAGTPGFRPPEVLLKYPHQTTAVDMWSAGVILLCLLSGKYPFFRAHDDLSAMAQIVGLFGSSECKQAAKAYGKDLICTPEVQPLNLKDLCSNLRTSMSCDQDEASVKSCDRCTMSCDHRHTHKRSRGQLTPSPTKRRKVLRSRNRTKSEEPTDRREAESECYSCSWNQIPESAYALMRSCLDLNPFTRITAEQALLHEFLQGD